MREKIVCVGWIGEQNENPRVPIMFLPRGMFANWLEIGCKQGKNRESFSRELRYQRERNKSNFSAPKPEHPIRNA